MGCNLSKQADIRDPSPTYNHTTPPLLETGKTRNRRQSKAKEAPRPSLKDQVRQLSQRGKGLSPIYNKMPKKAKNCRVKSVYDGDTITLRNNKRVRFLGIDTPELKNPVQAFSEEARAYTLQRCGGQQILISYEEGHDTEDRFGRQLCWVWVLKGSKYECVNEGLLKEGLASVYTPSNGCKLHNIDKLLAMQKEARILKKGMWRNFRDYEVVKPMYGSAFHHQNGKCEHLKRSKNLTPIQASHAMDEGRHACRTCLG